jgi:putative ABC transport system permease protein
VGAIPLESGRLFSSNDANEVILSPYYVESFGLESAEDLIGRKVTIPMDRTFMPVLGEFNPFPTDETQAVEYEAEVVGLMKRTLFSTAALIPHGTSIRLARHVQRDPVLHTDEKYGIVAVALVDREERAGEVVKAIKKLDLGARSEQERYQILNSVFLFINIALSLVGGAALGVAALGIANTLLMSVFERTREIGLYMALGATRRTIRWLFAVEAATIGLLGGVIGVGAAVGLGSLANLIFHVIMQDRWHGYALFHYPLWLLLGTVGFAILIASLAGLYPSHRASRLDPIAALRYD